MNQYKVKDLSGTVVYVSADSMAQFGDYWEFYRQESEDKSIKVAVFKSPVSIILMEEVETIKKPPPSIFDNPRGFSMFDSEPE